MKKKESKGSEPEMNEFIFGQSLFNPKPLRISNWKKCKKRPESNSETNHRRFKRHWND